MFADSPSGERRPTFLVPSGASSSAMVLRGDVLQLECIAEGLYVTTDTECVWKTRGVAMDILAKRVIALLFCSKKKANSRDLLEKG